MSGSEVLVVGAGPTGLTAAVELARRGIDVRVVEKGSSFQIGTRARGLSPRSMEVMDDLGLAERLLAVGSTEELTMRMYDKRGRSTDIRVPSAVGPGQGAPYPRGLVCGTWRIEEALRSRLAEHGVEVELDSAVTEVEQGEDGVRVTVESESGRVRRLETAYLIGADGGRSTVRKLLGIGFSAPGRSGLEGKPAAETTLLVADVRLDGMSREYVNHMWSRGAVLVPNPHEDTFWFSLGLAPGPDGTFPEPSLELCERLFHERTGRTEVRFRELVWVSTYRFNVRLADRYRVGRAFLAGDAAHVHIPAGGQGMNTGIQDAYNLAWKLAAVLRGAEPELLDSYQAERRPVAARVLADSTRRGLILMAQGIVMAAAARFGSVGRRFWRWWGSRSTQLDLHYRGSVLSREAGDTGGGGVRAGDRVPDLRLVPSGAGREVRLFDLMRGPHWTVLASGDGAADAVLRLRRRFGAAVRAEEVLGGTGDPDGREAAARLFGRAGSGDRPVVLAIRPDGYAGFRGGGDVRPVEEYLESVLGRTATMTG